MIKIGIECESIEETQTWGVARGINKLLEELSRRPELGNEFKFFLYFKARIPDYPYLASPLFVKKIVRLPFLPRSFSIYYYLLLPIKLWFEGLDMMYFPNYMLPLIHRGRSLVLLTDDIYYEMRNRQLPLRYRLAYRIFAGRAAGRATCVMALSESSKQALVKLFKISPARITVNHLGATTTAISDWQLAIGDYLLYVGQAFPRRHLRETILAFEKILPEFPELELVAIGADKYNPPVIENLVAQVNQRAGSKVVVHHNYVGDDELAALYANAKALVYVSDREAFGLPPLEALSYGIVPIVAEAEVNREIYGDNAFFVKNGNSINTIATAMKTALANKAKIKQIKLAAPEILKRYTWKAHTDRFLEIIREMTNA